MSTGFFTLLYVGGSKIFLIKAIDHEEALEKVKHIFKNCTVEELGKSRLKITNSADSAIYALQAVEKDEIID